MFFNNLGNGAGRALGNSGMRGQAVLFPNNQSQVRFAEINHILEEWWQEVF